jgi:dimethylaniline monooxygenase (N-oxide forming)
VVGAGPGGLVTAKEALEAGFDVTVFEAGDKVGGQWYTTADHSGVWPGMRTNTSRAMTAFSDLPCAYDLELHPRAEQIRDYLAAYTQIFHVSDRVALNSPVRSVTPIGNGWSVDGQPFDAVVVASGRFHRPVVPAGLAQFRGELLHTYDYPGKEAYRGRRVLVYGNGVSGHEVSSDIAEAEQVVSAYRKPRYVLQKVVRGVSSDWQWYTHIAALQRAMLPREEVGRRLTERVLAVAGNPRDFGAPAPDPNIFVAGHSLAQSYLEQVRAGRIVCRPDIAGVDGRSITFTDGSRETVDVVICATGYALDIPYLPQEVWRTIGPRLHLHRRTLHPDLPHLAFVGQFALQGPYFPLLELQARYIAHVWSGALPEPDEADMRRSVAAAPPPVDAHHMLAVELAEAAGVAPELDARPGLVEPLLFGPMLPQRYRLDGPGSRPEAAAEYARELRRSPRATVDPADTADLPRMGLGHLGGLVAPDVDVLSASAASP